MSSWEAAISNIRIVEKGIQSKLQVFSSFIRDLDASKVDFEAQSDRGEDIKQTIQNLIGNYMTYLDELQRICDSSENRSYHSILERQRSVIRDFRKDFNRMSENLQVKSDRLRLLHPGLVHQMSTEESEMHLLLKERSAGHSSVMMADEYLNQASETHSQLINQRRRMESSKSKMSGMLNRFPVVNDLMRTITDKKNRDNVIVAAFIAFCICFCIWYAFH